MSVEDVVVFSGSISTDLSPPVGVLMVAISSDFPTYRYRQVGNSVSVRKAMSVGGNNVNVLHP